MSKILQTFTLCYPDQEAGPKMLVCFTNFSKNLDDSDDGSFSVEEDWQIKSVVSEEVKKSEIVDKMNDLSIKEESEIVDSLDEVPDGLLNFEALVKRF